MNLVSGIQTTFSVLPMRKTETQNGRVTALSSQSQQVSGGVVKEWAQFNRTPNSLPPVVSMLMQRIPNLVMPTENISKVLITK